MALLPIVIRELRVQARRPSTFWWRMGLSAFGVLLCANVYLWTNWGSATNLGGGPAFKSLTWLAQGLALLAGFLTADCISSERREGTLGLLWLTDLKGYDVVLGKAASLGLGALHGLVAFVPVLAIPLLAGGVTLGEVVRTALAIANTMFVSLAIGLWASSRNHQAGRAMRQTAFGIGSVLLVGWFLPTIASPMSYLAAVSPSHAFRLASAGVAVAPSEFGFTLLAAHLVGWAFLAVANRNVMAGQRLDAGETIPRPETTVRGEPSRRRQSPVTDDPVSWLVSRQSGMRTLVWIALLLLLYAHQGYKLAMLLGTWIMGPQSAYFLTVANSFLLLIAGVLLARAAAGFSIQAKKSGVLEQLLVTPLGARLVIAGQWRALWDLLRRP